MTQPFNREREVDDTSREIIEQIRTDESGRYLIPLHPQGSYELQIFASGFLAGTTAIGPVDFLPENLVNGGINKSFVLNAYPQDEDQRLPVALFDPEDKKRMTQILIANGIRFENLLDKVELLSAARYRLMIIGHDATKYSEFNQLIAASSQVTRFLRDGSHLYIGQINDFTVEGMRLPFLEGDRAFMLHTESAPFNDFASGKILDPTHPLVRDVSFSSWQYIEEGQQQVKNNVVFDAAIRDSFTGPHWQIVVTTPAEDFSSGAGTVEAEQDVIIAEYTDPEGGGRIIVNQAAYFQGTFGDLNEPDAIQLTANVVAYLKALNRY